MSIEDYITNYYPDRVNLEPINTKYSSRYMKEYPNWTNFVVNRYYYPWDVYPDYYFESVKRTLHDKIYNPYPKGFKPISRMSMEGSRLGNPISRGNIIFNRENDWTKYDRQNYMIIEGFRYNTDIINIIILIIIMYIIIYGVYRIF